MASAPGAAGAGPAWVAERDRLLSAYESAARTVGGIEGRLAEKQAKQATLRGAAGRSGRGLMFDGGSEGAELATLTSEITALNAQLGDAQNAMFSAKDRLKDHCGGPRPPMRFGGKRKTRTRKTRRPTRVY
jgi:hypothetical protein